MIVSEHNLDALCVNTIRGLCMDAIERANSGHLETPLGVAQVAFTVWQRFLRVDPADPIWPNRDRFVLSEGHASVLLWSLLHLSGGREVDPDYEVLGRAAVSLDDLKTFRQLGSRLPRAPQYRWTSGVETTTEPLGQGVATENVAAASSPTAGTSPSSPTPTTSMRSRGDCAFSRLSMSSPPWSRLG